MPSAISDISSLSDREIVAALLARDRAITEAYFYRKCYPLFKSCFDKYYTDCETCLEFTKAFHPIHSYIIGTGGVSFEDFLKTDVTGWL